MSELQVADLAPCAAHYAWFGQPIGDLLSRFEGDRPLDTELLGALDHFTSVEIPFARLAAPAVHERLDAFFGPAATTTSARRVLRARRRATVARAVAAAVTGEDRAPVTPFGAFPATLLLRCLDGERYPVLASPRDLVMEMAALRGAGKGVGGQAWGGQWESAQAFAADYAWYAGWLTQMAKAGGLASPAALDEGCWMFSRCQGDAEVRCPYERAHGSQCPATQLARGDALLSTLTRRQALRQALLSRAAATQPLALEEELLAEALMPPAELVKQLFALPRPPEDGTHWGNLLSRLERRFGAYLASVLAEEHGRDRPWIIGRHLGTHGTAVKRRLELTEDADARRRRRSDT